MVPSVRRIEQQIRTAEGFEVHLLHAAGANVRGDKDLPVGYPSRRRAPDNQSVEDWKRNRFRVRFPGYDVEVLKGDGSVAPGQTLLSTVRASY